MLINDKMKKIALACVLATSMAACAAVEGRESAGQYVDDATITTKVKSAFVGDPVVSAMQVNVETMQGTVELSGFVDTAEAETRAVQLAYQVKGVKSVDDEIVVRTATHHHKSQQ